MKWSNKMKLVLPLILVFTLAACAANPTMQTGPDAERSYDGLVKIDGSRFREAWADPDAEWARYNKIMGGGSSFEFRAVKKSNRTGLSAIRTSNGEFWIDEDARIRLEQTVSEVFREELGKSERFEFTDTAGHDVIIIRGGLSDIVSNVPPQQAGRSDLYLRQVGEATLTIEVLDSNSREVIARVIERRAAGRANDNMMNANSVSTWAEVKRLARTWASKLRSGIDSLPTE
jgi:hypothetical protein